MLVGVNFTEAKTMKINNLLEGNTPKLPGATKGMQIMTPEQFFAKGAESEEELNEAPSWAKPVRSYMKGGPDDPAVKAKAKSAERYAKNKESRLADLRTEPIELFSDDLEKLADESGTGIGGRVEDFNIEKRGTLVKDGVRVAALKVTGYVDVDLTDMYDQQTIDQMYHGETHVLESFNATVYRDPQNPNKLKMSW